MKNYDFFDFKSKSMKTGQFDFFKVDEKKKLSFFSNLKENYKPENLYCLLGLIIVAMLPTSIVDKINIFCYPSGFILGFKTSLKLKEHSDAPVALGKPLIQLLLAGLLLAIPTLIATTNGVWFSK